MPRATQHEAEWLTRKRRIDPALDAAGWRRARGRPIYFRDVRHALDRSRPVAGFHTPTALRELLAHDAEAAYARLLVAMATGTRKTFAFVNEVYRLMRAGVVRRVLFLVDRRVLAAQAVRACSAFEAEPGQKFDQVYEVCSSRFQAGDATGGTRARS